MPEKVEQCGIVGVISKAGKSVFPLLYRGLAALQHRGQDSAGIAVSNGKEIKIKKGKGLVHEVFGQKDLLIEGQLGIGHTRYRTVGLIRVVDTQPFVKNSVAVAHNGQITNANTIKSRIFLSEPFASSVDSELFLHALLMKNHENLEAATKFILENFEGAYSTVALTNSKLVAFRDVFGLRPLVYGENSEYLAFASESCSLSAMDLPYQGDVFGGEAIIVDKESIYRRWVVQPKASHCMFEYVYFSRPDSKINGSSVFDARRRLGQILAEEAPVDADVVVGIPETARIAAQAFSERLSIPYEEGLVRNRFLLRTFILPDQKQRSDAVRMKISTMPSVLHGRRVVLVDDSIVRGTTTKEIVRMVREAGARSVHVRITCPPIISPCYFGVDMSTSSELLASGRSLREIETYIGADSLAYISLAGLKNALQVPLCTGCLTSTYPTK